MSDRTVHGLTVDGYAIVRYDRSGKWYIEPPRESGLKRGLVSVGEAAAMAAKGTHFPRRPGGLQFDRRVERA